MSGVVCIPVVYSIAYGESICTDFKRCLTRKFRQNKYKSHVPRQIIVTFLAKNCCTKFLFHKHETQDALAKTSAAHTTSPPRAWGKVPTGSLPVQERGITPTCVGKSKARSQATARGWDHPHLRGEKPSSARFQAIQRGSPPLAWGKVSELVFERLFYRITPTCVGKSCCRTHPRRRAWDHPHLRGEKLFWRGFIMVR